jgi:putative ABC transport system permease protein
MLGYYVKLAWKSFARTPGLTALMVAAIAVGIGICVSTLTVYHAMSGNPIWWKNDRLYAVTMDSWGVEDPYDKDKPELPPPQMGYRDATALFASTIPQRKAMMYALQMVISGGEVHAAPRDITFRVTSPDFFAMFDVPFRYGGPWSAAQDQAAEPVIVLSQAQNDKLFKGANSVGRTVRVGERDYRVTGVLDHWHPMPRFYDVNGSAFLDVEDAFIPFGLTTVLEQMPNAGTTSCHDEHPHETFREFINAECVWMQMWLELPDADSRARMQVFMDQYWAAQRSAGRFPRPRNNRLTNVGNWLHDNGVVSTDNTILVLMSFAFLGVCVINTVGLLLARFLNQAPITGVRRALGASRRQIFNQHLVEVALIATSGALLGLGLAALGLAALRAMIDTVGTGGLGIDVLGGYRSLARFDTVAVFWAIALAVLATLAAGLYPAWRVGSIPPARHLKSQ